jgi:hypothetical protein
MACFLGRPFRRPNEDVYDVALEGNIDTPVSGVWALWAVGQWRQKLILDGDVGDANLCFIGMAD